MNLDELIERHAEDATEEAIIREAFELGLASALASPDPAGRVEGYRAGLEAAARLHESGRLRGNNIEENAHAIRALRPPPRRARAAAAAAEGS